MPLRPHFSYLFLALICLPPKLLAHGQGNDIYRTELNSSASITARSKSNIGENEPWLIPGSQLGGEAFPAEKGFSLDDVQLSGTWVSSNQFSAHAKLMAHQAIGEIELELENFWLEIPLFNQSQNIELSIGKMTTHATPLAAWHASTSYFSEAPLLADVFWGRHFSDTGIHISKKLAQTSFGIETWNGNSWPGTRGDGSFITYIKHPITFAKTSINTGFWALSGKVEKRIDNRYSAGHNHGNDIPNPAGDFAFTGDQQLLGFYTQATLPIGKTTLDGRLEGIWLTSKGELNDNNQSSPYENNHQGYSIEISAAQAKHTFAARYQRVVLENRFYGDTSALFIEQASLKNNGFEPNVLNLSWLWQWRETLSFRTEYVIDSSQSTEGINRVNIGVVWSESFFRQ